MSPSLSLFDALPDFGTPIPPVSPPKAESKRFNSLSERLEPPAKDAVPPLQTQLDEMITAAEAALAEKLAQEHAVALQQERERHAEELEALRNQLGDTVGQAINNRFAALEDDLVTLTSQATTRILGGVLTEDLQKRSIVELERVIRNAIDDRETLRIRVSGSPALWESLKAGLGEKARHVDFAEAPGFDLSISVDEELFETRLTEWSETLAGLIS
ncbi:hypothetical protein ACFPOD_09175 [Nitratireductor kimnyeongensis]|uniref:Flagellar assembly protein FliH n=1 Tax=Nitratireductor kimnyeongensis TaxID=430679 RepID=A0ABW0T8Z7_9HYPH|nr:hypothetical protein [Nitratireductor kimnyeongensis]QZZ36240.1 hypothetical protein KW403_03585 [Nitratireductor kimnyeongensis]